MDPSQCRIIALLCQCARLTGQTATALQVGACPSLPPSVPPSVFHPSAPPHAALSGSESACGFPRAPAPTLDQMAECVISGSSPGCGHRRCGALLGQDGSGSCPAAYHGPVRATVSSRVEWGDGPLPQGPGGSRASSVN